MVPGPRLLYLHGFASGPRSKKGLAVEAHLAARGAAVERLDLRVPSLERLSFTAMLARTRAAIGGARDRAIVIGSSLGGLTAARLAEDEPRICALVLLAPALGFGRRWRERLGDDGWQAWMDTGWLEVHDHATGGATRVHADFAREVDAIDVGWPDVRVPTLILHGVDDDVVPIDRSRQFAADRRHVRLVELPDGHDLLATLPRILDELDRFLAPVLGA
ncbi:MAG: alpha/beta fold hydrolase [Kofleriaceae bacterium]|nr:alpha/beta fold hydrolase [Myxococcales bacterium]MCB9562784.1 alpha/beta fold hydrolase [Kofleriaceae bacterium]MCB9571103.1 alpha/beta fold hydrolase [Kofleriaceae bacterium]